MHVNLKDKLYVKNDDVWETVDIIDLKFQKMMTVEGHLFDFDMAELRQEF